MSNRIVRQHIQGYQRGASGYMGTVWMDIWEHGPPTYAIVWSTDNGEMTELHNEMCPRIDVYPTSSPDGILTYTVQ